MAEEIIHTVLMPFSRPGNIPTLREHMQGQRVEWVPLYHYDNGSGVDFCRSYDEPIEDWIKPFNTRWSPEARCNPGNWKLDRFFAFNVEMNPSWFSPKRFVSFMTDDCLWSYKHWLVIREWFELSPKPWERGFQQAGKLNKEVKAVFCAFRVPGDNVIYPNLPAEAADNFYAVDGQGRPTSNLCFRCTCFESITVRADLLEDWRFGHFWAMDGTLAEMLVKEHRDGIVLARDTVVYREALHPTAYGFPHHEDDK